MSRHVSGAPHFAEHGPVDAAGCCKWCGRKLRKCFDIKFHDVVTSKDALGKTVRTTKPSEKLKTFTLGDYGEGHFCGLRCGYAFGTRFADLGNRLRPVKVLHVDEAIEKI